MKKEISEDRIIHRAMCVGPLCEECGASELCSNCTELWIAEIDLEDMEAEEE